MCRKEARTKFKVHISIWVEVGRRATLFNEVLAEAQLTNCWLQSLHMNRDSQAGPRILILMTTSWLSPQSFLKIFPLVLFG